MARGEKRTLTVYRLKRVEDPPLEYLAMSPPELSERTIQVAERSWPLFIQKRKSHWPRWASFFDGHAARSEFGKIRSAAALLLVPVADAWYGVTFGHAKHLLKSEVIVEDFGLFAAINALGEEGIRSLDKETFDSIAGLARQQASRDTGFGEFALDLEKDLVRAVTGTPDNTLLASRLSGRDALGIAATVSIEELEDLLRAIEMIYKSDAYREKFSWIDQVKSVRDRELRAALDGNLFKLVAAGDREVSWLAPPEVIDWFQVRWFRYGSGKRNLRRHEMSWDSLISELRGELSSGLLKRKKVECVGEDDAVMYRWSAYRCINAEMELDGTWYLMSDGRWFQIDRDLAKSVSDFVRDIPLSEVRLPSFDDADEGEYNARAASSSDGHLCLMDKKLIPHGEGRSSVELCDLLGRGGEVVHVKRHSGPREMGHLFNQGMVSASLLKKDDLFVAKVVQQVPDTHSGLFEAPIRAGTFTIVFAIIATGELRLSLFSQISLRQVVKELRAYGFEAALQVVPVDEVRAVLGRAH